VPQQSGWIPGDPVEPDEHGEPVVLDGAGLLEQLGECVFVAERLGDAGAVRLVAGTSWSEQTAARFALDCVDHILGIVPGGAETELPGGGTLGAIIASARQYLEDGSASDAGRLGLVARIAATRRLHKDSVAIGDAAFAAAVQAEGQDADVVGDPVFETLAAARDAVLAAVEAVRHVALPFLTDRGTRKYEAMEERKDADVDEVDTPWGRFPVGGGGPKYVPSWVAARDAAVCARQAAKGLNGPAAGDAERDWQVGRLSECLCPK
jgi:hypothetical protein